MLETLITHRHRHTSLAKLRNNLASYFVDLPLSPLAVYRHNKIAGFVLTPRTYMALLYKVQEINEKKELEATRLPRVRQIPSPEAVFVKPPTTARWWETGTEAIDRKIAYNNANAWYQIWEQINDGKP